jgi:hypothetical protein
MDFEDRDVIGRCLDHDSPSNSCAPSSRKRVSAGSRTVAGVSGLMTMTVRISTTATCNRNGAGAHVTQLGNLHLNSGAAIFKVNEGVGHLQPP